MTDDDDYCLLPFELIVTIMELCDTSTLGRMACVCRRWRDYLMDPRRLEDRLWSSVQRYSHPAKIFEFHCLPDGTKHGLERLGGGYGADITDAGPVEMMWKADGLSDFRVPWYKGKIHGRVVAETVFAPVAISSVTYVNGVPHGKFIRSLLDERTEIPMRYGRFHGIEVTEFAGDATEVCRWRKGYLNGRSVFTHGSYKHVTRWRRGIKHGTEKEFRKRADGKEDPTKVSFWRRGKQVASLTFEDGYFTEVDYQKRESTRPLVWQESVPGVTQVLSVQKLPSGIDYRKLRALEFPLSESQ